VCVTTRAHTPTCTHKHSYVCVCVCVLYVCVCNNARTHQRTHPYTHARTHARMRARTHTHTQLLFSGVCILMQCLRSGKKLVAGFCFCVMTFCPRSIHWQQSRPILLAASRLQLCLKLGYLYSASSLPVQRNSLHYYVSCVLVLDCFWW
jgi:hypothetical protein